MSEATQAPLPEDQYVVARRDKLARLREAGADPFPPRAHRTHTCAEVHAQFEELERSQQVVAVAGRVTLLRIMGRASFVEIRDGSDRLQLFFAQDALGAERYQLLKDTLDLGDHIGAEGTVFLTRTGEQTVRARTWTMLSKALRPPPEKWHGLSDVESRLRRRHLDLMANPETRALLAQRSAIVREVRRFLDQRGFVEIETPVLQALHGGATARPFRTHHKALHRDLYLRISLELYLKRLLIGGYDKVYEIGRNFRNEGIDRRHNPEFTMLEAYEAYADYEDVMRLTEEMISTVAEEVLGTRTVTVQGQEVDVTPPWRRISHRQAILEQTGIDYRAHPTLEALERAVHEAGLHVEPQKTWAQLVDQLQSTFVEPRIVQPVFLVDYPKELSPLAKLKPGSSDTVERFEAFAAGIEVGNAFTELNDPDDQYRRFLEQAKQAQAGDEEAHTMDLDFIEAMQHGMPPAGGLGVGIDRLCMFLLDVPNIREVIAFPMLREEEAQS